MTGRRIIVFDCHYLCHRAFHTGQRLSHKGKGTEVVFGFLKSIDVLQDQFDADWTVFCFEHPHLYRCEIYPPYKRKRRTRERTKEEELDFIRFSTQVKNLRTDYLPSLGFKNVLCQYGYESDDLMAEVARTADANEDVILVTSDSDLYQCLAPNVQIYDVHKHHLATESWFRKEYGIAPAQYAVVKAIAGCNGDGVQGLRGVGEKTALAYLRGEMKPKVARKRILNPIAKSIVRRNRKLVELPYPGVELPELLPDSVTKQKWYEVCDALGMRSIAAHPPIRKIRRTNGKRKQV